MHQYQYYSGTSVIISPPTFVMRNTTVGGLGLARHGLLRQKKLVFLVWVLLYKVHCRLSLTDVLDGCPSRGKSTFNHRTICHKYSSAPLPYPYWCCLSGAVAALLRPTRSRSWFAASTRECMASELMALEPLCKYAKNFATVITRLPAKAS